MSSEQEFLQCIGFGQMKFSSLKICAIKMDERKITLSFYMQLLGLLDYRPNMNARMLEYI